MLHAFDRRETTWEGLWYHPESHNYTSAAINLSQLKKFKGSVRLIMIKNKFKKSANAPNYLFRIQDTQADANANEMNVVIQDGSLDKILDLIDEDALSHPISVDSCEYDRGFRAGISHAVDVITDYINERKQTLQDTDN